MVDVIRLGGGYELVEVEHGTFKDLHEAFDYMLGMQELEREYEENPECFV